MKSVIRSMTKYAEVYDRRTEKTTVVVLYLKEVDSNQITYKKEFETPVTKGIFIDTYA